MITQENIMLLRQWLDLNGKREDLLTELNDVNNNIMKVSGQLRESLIDSGEIKREDWFRSISVDHEDMDCKIQGDLLAILGRVGAMRFRWQTESQLVADTWDYGRSLWGMFSEWS